MGDDCDPGVEVAIAEPVGLEAVGDGNALDGSSTHGDVDVAVHVWDSIRLTQESRIYNSCGQQRRRVGWSDAYGTSDPSPQL